MSLEEVANGKGMNIPAALVALQGVGGLGQKETRLRLGMSAKMS